MSNALGPVVIVVSLISFVALLFVFSAGAGMAGGEEGEGKTYCDLRGDVSGLVRDVNLVGFDDKSVKDIVVQLDRANCSMEKPGILDQFAFKDFALFGVGTVDVTVKVFDASGDLVTSKKFTVTTDSGQTEKRFTEPLLFKKLEAGNTYSVKVYDSWHGNTAVSSTTVEV